jgi:unsaturated rhamnogalacturonyl hydrolase
MGARLLCTTLLVLLVSCTSEGNGGVEFDDAVAGADEVAETHGGVTPPYFDWCQPDSPPDSDCHAEKRAPDSANTGLASSIAQAQIARQSAKELAWNWEEAVLLLAMLELYAVTADPVLLEYSQAYMDHHISQGYQIGTSDNCVPAAVAVELYRHTGEEKYALVVQGALAYLYDEAKRTEEGGISHLGTVNIVTLWLDSLFMFGNVLMRHGENQDDATALDLFGAQFAIFSQLLQNPSGFYVHAYNWIVEQTPNVYWARGNGWVAAAGAMYLRIRANRGETDPAAAMALGKLLTAAVATQDDDTGLWWSILNKPGIIYVETSASALFAFGLARAWRYGLVGDEALATLAEAMQGIEGQIVEGDDGMPVVTGISGPTNADKFEQYALVPLEEDLPFGVGAVILALVETSGLPLAGESR